MIDRRYSEWNIQFYLSIPLRNLLTCPHVRFLCYYFITMHKLSREIRSTFAIRLLPYRTRVKSPPSRHHPEVVDLITNSYLILHLIESWDLKLTVIVELRVKIELGGD